MVKSQLVADDHAKSASVTAEFATLLVEQIGHVSRITLNRPEHHNPLTPRCMREILRAVELARGRPAGPRGDHQE